MLVLNYFTRLTNNSLIDQKAFSTQSIPPVKLANYQRTFLPTWGGGVVVVRRCERGEAGKMKEGPYRQ